MCGRFFVPEKDIDDFAGLVNQVEKELLKKAGEIFPGDYTPVITPSQNMNETDRKNSGDSWHAIKWGFPTNNGRPVINARSETVNEKPMFKLPFATRRCLIPARGFFEWKDSETSKKRMKHYISLKNEGLMYFAGMYWFFKDKEGILKPYFTIITTDANEEMKVIHDRMPVIITEYDKSTWLYEGDHKEELKALMSPLKSGYLNIQPVIQNNP